MESELLNVIKQILELGWPAIVLLQLYFIWRAYVQRTQEYLDVLKEVAGLRVTLPTSKDLKAQALPGFGPETTQET